MRPWLPLTLALLLAGCAVGGSEARRVVDGLPYPEGGAKTADEEGNVGGQTGPLVRVDYPPPADAADLATKFRASLLSAGWPDLTMTPEGDGHRLDARKPRLVLACEVAPLDLAGVSARIACVVVDQDP